MTEENAKSTAPVDAVVRRQEDAMVDRAEVVKQVLEVLNTKTKPPADSLVEIGETLTAIGKALKQLPEGQQRDCFKAAILMGGFACE